MPLPSSPIRVHLDVQAGLPDVATRLTFRNGSRSRALLYRVNACPGGRIMNDLFVIMTADGRRLHYKGRLYRRAPAKVPDDFIALEPGESYAVTVKLGQSYDFSGRTRRCVVQYEAIDPSPPDEELFEMKSDPVAFDP